MMDLAQSKPDFVVRFEEVVKSFGTLKVLDGLNLGVSPGETLSIIGPSGSGKTTVLRTLMTLETIDSGVIYVSGEPLSHEIKGGRFVQASSKHLRRLRGQIGMCFQGFNLFPHMTALENCMEAPIHVLKLSKHEARERCVELLDMVGLSKKLEELPARLSGGQLQRVAIARALAMRPRIMLFDEVTSALDPEVTGEVTTVLKRLAKEHDLTMILVTHQMGFAREISDRICFFDQGRIEEEGSPQELFDYPKSERTKRFLSAVKEAV